MSMLCLMCGLGRGVVVVTDVCGAAPLGRLGAAGRGSRCSAFGGHRHPAADQRTTEAGAAAGQDRISLQGEAPAPRLPSRRR